MIPAFSLETEQGFHPQAYIKSIRREVKRKSPKCIRVCTRVSFMVTLKIIAIGECVDKEAKSKAALNSAKRAAFGERGYFLLVPVSL